MSRARRNLRGAMRAASSPTPHRFYIHHPRLSEIYIALEGKEARRAWQRSGVRFPWAAWKGTWALFPPDFREALARHVGPHRRGEEGRGAPPRGRVVFQACKRGAGWAVALVRAGKIDVPQWPHFLR